MTAPVTSVQIPFAMALAGIIIRMPAAAKIARWTISRGREKYPTKAADTIQTPKMAVMAVCSTSQTDPCIINSGATTNMKGTI